MNMAERRKGIKIIEAFVKVRKNMNKIENFYQHTLFLYIFHMKYFNAE